MTKTQNQTKTKARKLTQLLDANFKEDGYFITLTYAPDNRPTTMAEARKSVNSLLRKIKRFTKRQELPTLKYIYTTSMSDNSTILTNRIIANFGYRPWIEAFWTQGKVGIREITTNSNSITATDLATYLLTVNSPQTISKSKNLKKGATKP